MCDEHSEVIEVCVDAVWTSEFSNSAIELVCAIVRIFLQKNKTGLKQGWGNEVVSCAEKPGTFVSSRLYRHPRYAHEPRSCILVDRNESTADPESTPAPV